jgi:hypothetical protein
MSETKTAQPVSAKPKPTRNKTKGSARTPEPSYWDMLGLDEAKKKRLEQQIANAFRVLDTDQL